MGTVTVLSLAGIAFVGYAMARVARAVVVPVRKRPQNQRILAVDPVESTVTLAGTPDASVPGRYGLWFDDDSGYARIGGVVDRSNGTVTRTLIDVVFGELHPTNRARLSGWYYLTPEELGFDVESVEIETTLGQAPAWHIPAGEMGADQSRWVIQVHGWGAARPEGLRAVPVFHASGYSSLLISYRNDPDAPASEDKRYGLGGTEWLDVEAAIRFAKDRGATSIVLMGWSMGGAVVLQTITRSPSADLITGLVLESPVIDWIDALEYQAKLLKLPPVITLGALRIIGSEWGAPITGQGAAIDFASMDFVARAADLSLPMLVLHSDDDGWVPSTSSRALAVARPDIVTFVPFATALHTKLWNYDEERWRRSIAEWLTAHVTDSSRSRERSA
ncbi:alpha/beta hydrolase [Diaminobutyricibacter tongyongensis]|uniref:Alpha/beta hydrolase n=2 Tax=Leifsonia tongyongensis TaxID=1268043 RepID=A0A6L9XY47_9MICO|nr:alpha/beta fold hydrolase [Diaminobutyricibacter tongyongensis]NEN06351.1 alpha/beta hydrolase [Diaminobutyricibacter tongyongensis]